MLTHASSINECESQARFCWLWGLVSSVGMVLGMAVGFWFAVIIGVVTYIVTTLYPWLAPFMLSLSVAAVGVVTGIVVGMGQSSVLPWSREARGQWLVRNLFGWGIGAGLGGFLAFLYESQFRTGGPVIAQRSETLVMVLMTPILGLVLGLALRPALPSPAPSLALWLAVNVVAVSFGWIAAWLLVGSSTLFGLSWTGLVLGPLVYGMISGALMV
jgi:hypothetical protein